MSAPERAPASRALKTTTNLRDAAAMVATLAATTVQAVAGLWFAVALVAVAGATWVVVRRTRVATRQSVLDPARIVQVSFLVLGISLVWRLDFRLLALAVLGMWALVCAADLDRLAQRFPLASSARYQRELVGGHLRALGVVAAVSAVAAGAATFIRLELRLATVMLLALFVVVVVLRVGRELTHTREESRGEDERADAAG